MMSPLVKKTYAPRGRTPVLSAWDDRTRFSAIGAILVPPNDRRPRFEHCLLGENENFTSERVVTFLRHLGQIAAGPLKIIWDRAPIHRGAEVKAFLRRCTRYQLFHLPAYSPQLNPVEGCWAQTKYHQLGNLVPRDKHELHFHAQRALNVVSKKYDVLRGCITHTGLGDEAADSLSQRSTQ